MDDLTNALPPRRTAEADCARTADASSPQAAEAALAIDATSANADASEATSTSTGTATSDTAAEAVEREPEAASAATARTTQLTDEYLAEIAKLDGDAAGRIAARKHMDASSARYHGEIVPSAFVPRLFDDASWETLRHVAETTHRALCKVMRRYCDDSDYRRLFSYDPRLEELALLPLGHDSLLPFARIDGFFDETRGTFRFCEFNADGSSGMNEDREVWRSIADTPSYRAFAQRHRMEPCELFDSWVEAFLRIYRTFPGAVNNPHIAICDYLDLGVVDEFEQYAACFAARGLRCSIVDVRTLRFDGHALRDAHGTQIHAIWRRCVTNDVREHWNETQALIQAAKHQAVALIGGFIGHVVHDKQLFRVLRHPATLALLDNEERALMETAVPYTEFLRSDLVDAEAVKRDKDAWVIKPCDSYGAHGVYVGAHCPQGAWEAAVERHADDAEVPYLLQEFVEPHRTLTVPLDASVEGLRVGEDATVRPVSYRNLSGLFLYDGHFQGVFSRIGPHPIVCGAHEGLTAATVRVRD